MTVPVWLVEAREERPAQIFVAVLGCSNYTYLEAIWTQKLGDWTASHRRALEFFGATPAIVACDNLRSAVRKAHRYDPELNPTYRDLAVHYDFAVVPARVRKPRDKALIITLAGLSPAGHTDSHPLKNSAIPRRTDFKWIRCSISS